MRLGLAEILRHPPQLFERLRAAGDAASRCHVQGRRGGTGLRGHGRRLRLRLELRLRLRLRQGALDQLQRVARRRKARAVPAQARVGHFFKLGQRIEAELGVGREGGAKLRRTVAPRRFHLGQLDAIDAVLVAGGAPARRIEVDRRPAARVRLRQRHRAHQRRRVRQDPAQVADALLVVGAVRLRVQSQVPVLAAQAGHQAVAFAQAAQMRLPGVRFGQPCRQAQVLAALGQQRGAALQHETPVGFLQFGYPFTLVQRGIVELARLADGVEFGRKGQVDAARLVGADRQEELVG